MHGVVQQRPAQPYQVGPRWWDLAVHQDDPDDRRQNADEVDAHTDGQNRLPGTRRPQEGDQADADDGKTGANHPQSPDGQPPVCAVARIHRAILANDGAWPSTAWARALGPPVWYGSGVDTRHPAIARWVLILNDARNASSRRVGGAPRNVSHPTFAVFCGVDALRRRRKIACCELCS